MFTLKLGYNLFYEFDIFEGDGLVPNDFIYLRKTNVTLKESVIEYMDDIITFIANVCRNNKLYYLSHKNLITPFNENECIEIEEKVKLLIKTN